MVKRSFRSEENVWALLRYRMHVPPDKSTNRLLPVASRTGEHPHQDLNLECRWTTEPCRREILFVTRERNKQFASTRLMMYRPLSCSLHGLGQHDLLYKRLILTDSKSVSLENTVRYRMDRLPPATASSIIVHPPPSESWLVFL
eukprot:scaffold212256_cov59-Attheya_sp.AAC.1